MLRAWQAEPAARMALSLTDGQDGAAWEMLGRCLADTGDIDGARDAFRRSLAIGGQDGSGSRKLKSRLSGVEDEIRLRDETVPIPVQGNSGGGGGAGGLPEAFRPVREVSRPLGDNVSHADVLTPRLSLLRQHGAEIRHTTKATCPPALPQAWHRPICPHCTAFPGRPPRTSALQRRWVHRGRGKAAGPPLSLLMGRSPARGPACCLRRCSAAWWTRRELCSATAAARGGSGQCRLLPPQRPRSLPRGADVLSTRFAHDG